MKAKIELYTTRILKSCVKYDNGDISLNDLEDAIENAYQSIMDKIGECKR